MAKNDLTETQLDSRVIFDGTLLHVRKDRVRLPNGVESYREYLVHPGAVVVIPFLDENTLIMERQFRYPVGQVFYELPAGKTDPGEDYLTTGKRELLEETGYSAGRWEMLTAIHPAVGYSNEKMALYAAYNLTHTSIKHDDDEFLEILTIPLTDALELMRAGKITDAKTMVGLFWAEKLTKGEWIDESRRMDECLPGA